MAQGVQAIQGNYNYLGNNYTNLYNDPYFLAAYNSPNINQNQQNMQNTQGAQIGQAPVGVPQTQNNTVFQGQQTAETKKSNKTAKTILGIASAAALIFAGYKCHGKGVGDGFFNKILDGGKKYWNQFVNWIGGKKFETKHPAARNPKIQDPFVYNRTNIKPEDLTGLKIIPPKK